MNNYKKNQTKIVEAIEYNPAKAITYDGLKLPALDGDEEDWDKEDGDEKDKPKTSVKTLNIDKGINDEYKGLLYTKGLPLPSIIMKDILDVDDIIKKVDSKIKRAKNYIETHSTKKGQPLKSLKPIEITTYERNKNEIPYLKDYLARLQHIKVAPKYMDGQGLYKHKKRNAYKKTHGGQYGNLVIDIPKLIGQLHLIATKDGQKVIDKKVDFDTIDLLTKRLNSKKKYSPLSKRVFDELNILSEIPIHKSSKKV